MPWKVADVESKIKGLSDKQKAVWVEVANKALASCLAAGRSTEACEGSAIRQANAVAKGIKEGHLPLDQAMARYEEALAYTEVLGEAVLRKALAWSTTEALIRQALRDVLETPEDKNGLWIRDYIGNSVVYDLQGRLYTVSFTIVEVNGIRTVSFGTSVEVEIVYVPLSAESQESIGDEAELLGDLVPLSEKAVRQDGIVSVKLIQPGWGSSGYYPPDVLERDGPTAYTAGTQMFWNHQTETEALERPEGDLRDLAGELMSAAHYDEHGPAGPGLYANAKVFKSYEGAVDELAPHIGVSIRAMGRVKEGEADGRKGMIVQAITSAVSADFVTAAGAGGQILELFESARGGNYKPNSTRREDNVTDEEAKALQEANEAKAKENAELKAELARLREAAILRGARDYVMGKVAATDMPDITRTRLIEALSQNPPVKDGKLDEETLAETVKAGVTAELDYLAKVRGSGQIKGMGSTGNGDADEGALEEAYTNLYRSQGLGAEESKKLAALAADRR
ncbi:MAG: hypothetical protein V3V32_04410 [Dehalococcoidia bacterium]